MVREILVLVRPQNGLIVALSFAAGWLWFAPVGTGLWIGIAVVYLLHSAGTIRNDIVDRETDRINKPDRPLVTGKISQATAEALFFGFMLLTVAFAILGGPAFLIWGALLYFGAWLYNEPPFLGSHRPISSIVLMAVCFTTLPFIFGAQVGSGQMFLTSAPFILTIIGLSLSRAATSIFKDFKDVVGDKATGKKTFLLEFGSATTARSGFLLSIVGGALLLGGTAMAKGVGLEAVPAALFVVIGIWYRLRVARDPEKGTENFSPIYTNEIRLQLAHLLWIVWP